MSKFLKPLNKHDFTVPLKKNLTVVWTWKTGIPENDSPYCTWITSEYDWLKSATTAAFLSASCRAPPPPACCTAWACAVRQPAPRAGSGGKRGWGRTSPARSPHPNRWARAVCAAAPPTCLGHCISALKKLYINSYLAFFFGGGGGVWGRMKK